MTRKWRTYSQQNEESIKWTRGLHDIGHAVETIEKVSSHFSSHGAPSFPPMISTLPHPCCSSTALRWAQSSCQHPHSLTANRTNCPCDSSSRIVIVPDSSPGSSWWLIHEPQGETQSCRQSKSSSKASAQALDSILFSGQSPPRPSNSNPVGTKLDDRMPEFAFTVATFSLPQSRQSRTFWDRRTWIRRLGVLPLFSSAETSHRASNVPSDGLTVFPFPALSPSLDDDVAVERLAKPDSRSDREERSALTSDRAPRRNGPGPIRCTRDLPSPISSFLADRTGRWSQLALDCWHWFETCLTDGSKISIVTSCKAHFEAIRCIRPFTLRRHPNSNSPMRPARVPGRLNSAGRATVASRTQQHKQQQKNKQQQHPLVPVSRSYQTRSLQLNAGGEQRTTANESS